MRVFFLLLILIVTDNVFSSQPSTRVFLDNIRNSSYDSYLYGLESGLDWANEFTYRKHNYEIFCKPNDFDLSAENLKKLIIDEINQNSEFYNKYSDAPLIGLALRNSYLVNFPCK